ncbi:MAG TPA: putative glycoside hydrolase [Longimicrobiaceae bacterium]|nr:putative glycoside hydrolase [Longimicrobiaceae bacterium]
MRSSHLVHTVLALVLSLAGLAACGPAESQTSRTDVAPGAGALAASSLRSPSSPERSARPARARSSPSRREAPEQIRGIYVNAAVAGSPKRLERLLALADSTEINAFVVDVKTADGVRFRSGVALADRLANPRAPRIARLDALADTLHAHHLYAIARVVTFKDPRLSKARPAWSILKPGGGLWVDKVGNTWVSPWDPNVWEYDIAIAEAAARAGFDEIQFDYVRFPEAYESLPPQVHPEAQGDRTDAIAAFLAEAGERLHPLGVAVSADVFGMSMDEADDVGIGQQWERLSVVADRLLPMVYPSHFLPTHLPGVPRPNRMPYQTVRTAVGMGVIRNHRLSAAGGHPARITPWLQAFDAPWVDPDFRYGPDQARAQMEAVYDDGLDGWILWNPSSSYDAVAPALAPTTESHARPYTPPAPLVRRIDRYEGWGMHRARARALGGPPSPRQLPPAPEA